MPTIQPSGQKQLTGIAFSKDKRLQRWLNSAQRKALESEKAIALWRLDPKRRGTQTDSNHLKGYKITQRVLLKTAEDRRVVLGALYQSIAEGDDMARCFIPRHALIAGDQILVICFECSRVVYFLKDYQSTIPISGAALKVFEKLLGR